jgi:mRNA-degrading endonuclease RelE of RelBE toxin-antitoxin system
MGLERVPAAFGGSIWKGLAYPSRPPRTSAEEVGADVSYRIVYAPATEEHLRALTARQRTTVFDGVDEQLVHQPAVETRNRKPMRPNPLAPWELRIGDLRVYYDVEETPESVVTILAIGIKDRNRVMIGGEEVEL